MTWTFLRNIALICTILHLGFWDAFSWFVCGYRLRGGRPQKWCAVLISEYRKSECLGGLGKVVSASVLHYKTSIFPFLLCMLEDSPSVQLAFKGRRIKVHPLERRDSEVMNTFHQADSQMFWGSCIEAVSCFSCLLFLIFLSARNMSMYGPRQLLLGCCNGTHLGTF